MMMNMFLFTVQQSGCLRRPGQLVWLVLDLLDVHHSLLDVHHGLLVDGARPPGQGGGAGAPGGGRGGGRGAWGRGGGRSARGRGGGRGGCLRQGRQGGGLLLGVVLDIIILIVEPRLLLLFTLERRVKIVGWAGRGGEGGVHCAGGGGGGGEMMK